MKHTFDWQKEERGYKNSSFLAWFLPHVLVKTDTETMSQIAEKSNKYQNVEIGITLNGIEIDAKDFLEGLEDVIMGQAEAEAKEALTSLDYLNTMREEIDRLEGYLKRGVDEAAETLGIEINSWN